MESPIKERWNIFKDLVGLFDNKSTATFTALLVLLCAFLFYRNGVLGDENKEIKDRADAKTDRLYGMVIDEVRRQVPGAVGNEVNKQTKEIRLKMDTAASKLDTAVQILSNKHK